MCCVMCCACGPWPWGQWVPRTSDADCSIEGLCENRKTITVSEATSSSDNRERQWSTETRQCEVTPLCQVRPSVRVHPSESMTSLTPPTCPQKLAKVCGFTLLTRQWVLLPLMVDAGGVVKFPSWVKASTEQACLEHLHPQRLLGPRSQGNLERARNPCVCDWLCYKEEPCI